MKITRQLALGMQEQRAALNAAIAVLMEHQVNAKSGYARDAIDDLLLELADETSLLTSTLSTMGEPPRLEVVAG